jgi:hypothetical protein
MTRSRWNKGLFSRTVALAVTLGLLTAPLQSAPQAAPAAEGASKLRIVILEGEGAVNNIRQRTARDPVVKVVDENDRPVAGAVVMFTMPLRGPGGTFANGARSVTMLTNSQGVATTTGMTPNAVAGEFGVQVNASYQGQTASTTIAQTNAVGAAAGASTAATLGIIGGIAAGVAVAVVVGLSGDSGPTTGGPVSPPIIPPPPPTVTFTIGPPTAGPGR